MLNVLLISFLLIANPVLIAPTVLDQPFTETPSGGPNYLQIALPLSITPPTEDEKLEGYYQYAREWLQVPDNRNIRLEEFFTFVGGSLKRRSLITKYFLLNTEAELHKDNINVALFKTFVRVICNNSMSDPAFILRERVTMIEAQKQATTPRTTTPITDSKD